MNSAKDLKIYADDIEETAKKQIDELLSIDVFNDCKVRIMPDCHAGAGCVIGFTADLGERVIPNVVGVDIGCGMLAIELEDTEINLEQIDQVIRQHVPYGFDVNEKPLHIVNEVKLLRCKSEITNEERIMCGVGSLGGGNHFIEIDKDENGVLYLVIHSGSRNLGKQVADIYQRKAINNLCGGGRTKAKIQEIVCECKKNGKEAEIQKEIERVKAEYKCDIPHELCYLEGKDRDDYLYDMGICQKYATLNRESIAHTIMDNAGLTMKTYFETKHNYIDMESNIVRKGAISARKGEKVIIPMNMRDGSIIAIGKGNADWNMSAPHGAGRVMGRKEAKKRLSLDDFKETMKGIYSTSVSAETIDESPMAYKPMGEIVKWLEPTVDIQKIIRPIYNFKAE